MFSEEEQRRHYELVYDRIQAVLQRYGQENPFAKGDYFVLDENWGAPQSRVEINNLRLLRPDVVEELRAVLHDLPDWQIVVAVDVCDKEAEWPAMGLIIRTHEIIDGLRREYLPKWLHEIRYERSRPGSAND